MSGIGEALLISAAVSAASAGLTYALTPTQKIESGRISDLTTPKSNYGAAIPWCWGTVRVAGNLIWSTFLEEDKTTKRQGKGSKVQTTDYSYYGSFASLICECPFRPVVDYRRVWLNKKLVISQVGGAETIAEGGKFAGQYTRMYFGNKSQDLDPLLQNVTPIQNFNFGIPADRSQRADFLRSQGIDPNASAYTPAYNERAHLVFQRLPLGDFFNSLPTVEAEIVASSNCTAGQIVGDIMSLRYPQGSYDVSQISTSEFYCNGFFLNSIEAAKKAIQTLQQAYFFDLVEKNGVKTFVPIDALREVITLSPGDLAAHPSGSQKPFDYEIIESDTTSLPSEVIVNYIDPNLNYDTNEQRSQGEYLANRSPNPLTISLPIVMNADQAANIADRTFFLSFNQSKTYKFQLPPAYLDLEIGDLISGLFEGAGLVKLIQSRIGANLILDIEAQPYDLTFWSYKRNLTNGEITVGVANYNLNIPVTGAVTGISRIEDGYIYQPNIDYVVNPDGSVTILSGGGILEGTELAIATVSFPYQSDVGQGQIIPYSNTQLLVLDVPLVDYADEDYTLYLAAAGSGKWNGCSVFISTDNLRYFLLTTIKTPSIIGTCTTLIDDSVSLNQSISVQTIDNELESISAEDAKLEINLALFGNQVRLFRDAELVGSDVYQLGRLSNPTRGSQTQSAPQIGDRFILLKGDGANLTKVKYQVADIGQTRYFKAVSSGQTLDQVAPIVITLQGNAQRPYPPKADIAYHDLPGNITIEWFKGDRHQPGYFADYTAPTVEAYELNILNAQGTIVRTFADIHTFKFVYSVADQIADFGAIQTTINIKLAEVTADYGVGSYLTKALTPFLSHPAPVITDFSPKSAPTGTTITVTGSGFYLVTAAYVGGSSPEQDLLIINDQTLTFKLGSTTVSGLVRVVGSSGVGQFNDYPLIVTAQAVAQPVNLFPAAGLVHYFNFNSTTQIQDKVGNAYLTGYSGMPPGVLSQGVRGGSDQAITYNSIYGQRLAVLQSGAARRLRYTESSFSVSFWYKTTGQPAAISGQDPHSNLIFGDLHLGSDTAGTFVLYIKDNKFWLKGRTGSTNRYYSSAVSLVSGAWHHLALVYNYQSYEIKLYVNNNLEVSSNTVAPLNLGANGLTINGSSFADGVPNSAYDEMGIWHTALTAAQVGNLWNSGAGSFF